MAKKVNRKKRKVGRPKTAIDTYTMPPKWHKVIGLMASGGLRFQDAMRAAGYSEGYYKTSGHMIKQDPRFAKCLREKMASIVTESESLRDRRIRTLNAIIDNPDTSSRDIIAAVKEQAAIMGWHSETIRHESTERQAQLDEAARQEAARLAALALDTRSLPDVTRTSRRCIPSVVIEDVEDIDVPE